MSRPKSRASLGAQTAAVGTDEGVHDARVAGPDHGGDAADRLGVADVAVRVVVGPGCGDGAGMGSSQGVEGEGAAPERVAGGVIETSRSAASYP